MRGSLRCLAHVLNGMGGGGGSRNMGKWASMVGFAERGCGKGGRAKEGHVAFKGRLLVW